MTAHYIIHKEPHFPSGLVTLIIITIWFNEVCNL